jgi:membrane-associated protease RseP (regulator of RpoE activity)
MRIAWYTYFAASVWLFSAPSLLAQDFLKQLEQKLFQKQQESKGTEEKSNAKPAAPLTLPSVLEPTETVEAEELPPKKLSGEDPASKEAVPEGDANAEAGALPMPSVRPTMPLPNRMIPSPFPSRPKPNTMLQAKPNGGGYLGLEVATVPGGGFGLNVINVTADSPAWKGGFRIGDRIIGVSGQAVTTIEAFADQLARFSPGTPVKFLVDRRGRQATLVAVLQDSVLAGKIHGNEPGTAIELAPGGNPAGSARAFLGINVSDMSDGFRKQFAIPAYRGASVTNVVDGSPADAAGLRPGDCIVDIDGTTVQSANAVLDAVLNGRPGQVINVSYYRGRQLYSASIALTMEQPPMKPSNPYAPVNPSIAEITPEMLTPDYVAGLQSELERVQNELANTQQRMQQLEARLQSLEKKR